MSRPPLILLAHPQRAYSRINEAMAQAEARGLDAPLVWAAAPAIIVGVLATYLPEWAELAFGIPAILLAYGAMIWRYGFGPEDRVLFRRNLEEPAAETGPTAEESRP